MRWRCSTAASASILSTISAMRSPCARMVPRKRARSSAGIASPPDSTSSALPRIAASGLLSSWVSACTYCSTYCLPSSRSRIVSSARLEVAELTRRVRRRDPFSRGHGIGIAAQRAELARQPPRRQQADGQRGPEQHESPAQDRALAARDERRDGLVGLRHGQHADDAVADRHCDRRSVPPRTSPWNCRRRGRRASSGRRNGRARSGTRRSSVNSPGPRRGRWSRTRRCRARP